MGLGPHYKNDMGKIENIQRKATTIEWLIP